jgi:hypothetical protein
MFKSNDELIRYGKKYKFQGKEIKKKWVEKLTMQSILVSGLI